MTNNIGETLFCILDWGAKAGDLFGGIGIFFLTLRTLKREQVNRKNDLFWSNIKHKEEVLNRISFDKEIFGLKALKKYGEADLNSRLKNIKHYVNFCEHIFQDILNSDNPKRSEHIRLIESVFHHEELLVLKKIIANEVGIYKSTEKILMEIGIT